MGIYLPNMEMPKNGETITITICNDGIVFEERKEPGSVFKGISVPDHGDLIDRDGIKWIEEESEVLCYNDRWTVVKKIAYKAQVDKLPTIIHASGGKENVDG